MKFEIKTLVDVTNTNARKGQDPLAVNQQANFNTLYNVIGLRTNPTEFEVESNKEDVSKLGFGKSYEGKQQVWTVRFVVEAEDSISIDEMNSDFDLVPVITGLTETAKLPKSLFITSNKQGGKNILFKKIDK